jgi:hypothetical protein
VPQGTGITDEEKVRTRHVLGYLNVQFAFTFVLGVPSAVQTQFTIEGAFTRILPAALPEFRRILGICERIENQMVDDLELLAVEQVDEIHVRKDEQAALWKEYEKWRRALANLMGIAPNPFDQRLQVGGVNVHVNH